MQIYLVGGAVRDKLLGYPHSEKDWVVVGATPEDMLQQGFKAVGKDFPVFLHPDSKEEYALARTERKTGPGYTGFDFYSTPDVTLKEDLRRRDLTINAMAEADKGELIDPYGGREDLHHKILRHVSEAFAEDPVRILRVARFAARYQHLGFTVAKETQTLMRQMVESGEADHLVPERVWKELSRALIETNPEAFITTLRGCGALACVLPEVDALFGVPQPQQHHPEIDCGQHILLVLQQACRLTPDPQVRLAAVLHDLGKATTPPTEWPQHIGHEQRSVDLVLACCARLAIPKDYRDLAVAVARYHSHCHRALELTPKTVIKVLQELDAFRRPQRFEQFLLCCEADARGREGLSERPYPQADYLRQTLDVCNSIAAKEVAADGFKGKALGEELNRRRIQAIQTFKQQHQDSQDQNQDQDQNHD